MSTATTAAFLPPAWCIALEAAGFVSAGDAFRRNGLVFRPADRWLVWELSLPEAGPDTDVFGQPGLWQRMPQGDKVGLCFAVPAKAVGRSAAADGEGSAPGLAAFLEWVVESAGGRLPARWRPPARAEVLAWLSPDALTWRCGSFVRQGELLLDPGRWAFRFPILRRLPDDVPAARAQFLHIFCRDAMARWRMVRVGVASVEGGRGLIAETDLSGAPPVAPLVLASLESLKNVVGWLVEAAELLADVSVTLRVLETVGLQTPNERTEP